jgi:hypothetical protein
MYKLVASGTVAAADIAATLADGSADIDISSATIPRNYQGHLLKVYDSSNVCIQGYVYTNGAGTVQNIVSAKGGSTRNWAAQGAGFDDTTNCRYELWKVNNLVAVSGFGGDVTAANEHVSTVAGTAFYFSDALDFSAYQDGRHYLRLQDATGKVAWAKIKAETPAAIAYGAELITTWTNKTTAPFETLTVNANGHDIDSAINTEANGVACGGTTTSGTLLYMDFTVTIITGSLNGIYFGAGVGAAFNPSILVKTLPAGANTIYATTYGVYVSYGVYAPIVNFSSLCSSKQVTVPPATGVILNDSAAAQNFIYVASGFNGNTIANVQVYYYGD